MHLTLLHPVPLSLDWLGPNFEVFYADSLWALVCIISNAPMLSTFKQYQMKVSAKRSDLLMATIMASGMSFFMTLFATLLREGLTPRLSDAMGKLVRHQTWHKLPAGLVLSRIARKIIGRITMQEKMPSMGAIPLRVTRMIAT